MPVKVLDEPMLLEREAASGPGGALCRRAFIGDQRRYHQQCRSEHVYERHRCAGVEVSLLLHDWPEFNNVAVSEDGFVLGFGREAKEVKRGATA